MFVNSTFFAKDICLRSIQLSDCTEQYLSWLQNKEVNQYLETRWFTQSTQSIAEFIQSVRESADSYLFAIIEISSGKHIGNIKIGPINQNHHFADISYFIGEHECWGKGYITQAIGLVTKFGFEILGLHRLQAGIYSDNVASGIALQKIGFIKEACLRRKLKINNSWNDHIIFGLLREEWTEKERFKKQYR